MKSSITRLILIVYLAGITAFTAQAQVNTSGGYSSSRAVSSNIGTDNYAYGPNSFAGGLDSYARGSQSMAFGWNDSVSGSNAFAIGTNVRTTHDLGITIGSGVNSAHLFQNGSKSIMLGVNSIHPTLTVSESPNDWSTNLFDKTGKVAIGDVTPEAKLHIRSDAGEDAGIILVPAQTTQNSTFIRMRDNGHHITVNSTGSMELSASVNNQLNVTSKYFKVEDRTMEIGKNSDQSALTLSSQYTPALGVNAYPTSGGYTRNFQGPSYVLEFGNTGLMLRTATYAAPTVVQTTGLITNWRNAVSVKTNGAITLNGQVGVNIENTYNDYALAVDGGIISTKVHIQDVNDWQDRVFDEGYRLMSLAEVEDYVAANRHLPGVLSEAEVRAEGFDMAEMASALLGKVEELTLHVIRQQKEIDSLRTVVTVSFGYDACGNRTSRTLMFTKGEDGRGGDSEGAPKDDAGQWQALLSDSFAGMETILFPNPTEGGFFLTLGGGDLPAGATAVLCAVDGTVLEERAVNSTTEEFDLSRCPAGIYLLRLSSGGETRVWKVIKRN